MFALARGCSEFFLIWALAGFGIYFLYTPGFSPPGPLWSGVVGGFFLAGGWGLVRNALVARQQAALVRDSLNGDMPIEERPYAAIGRAVAVHEPLLTPFRKRPCVLYSYELAEHHVNRVQSGSKTQSQKQRIVHFSGMAMTEWAVLTKNGPVRVCAFPVPDQFEEVVIDTNSQYSRIREYCDETDFTRVGKLDFGKMLNVAGAVLRESSGQLREDLWFDSADEILNDRSMLQQCRLIEQAIEVDQPICVIGRFDRMHNGLINDLNTGGLNVLAGEPSQAIGRLRSTAAYYLFFALIMVLLGSLGSYALMSLRERDLVAKQPVVDRGAELVEAFESGDWDRFSNLISEGVSPDSRDSVGRTLLLAAIDQGKTLEIERLLDAGADVNAAQTGWNRRPIEAAFDRGQTGLVAQLLARGGTGEYVDRNTGQPLNAEIDDLEAMLRQYTRGLDESDASLIRSISDGWPSDFFESVGRGLYKDTRPIEWKCVEGYRANDVATFIAEGQTRRGIIERYLITAKLVDRSWKLRRVYWDEFSSFQFNEAL
jgi:hypothetical protein